MKSTKAKKHTPSTDDKKTNVLPQLKPVSSYQQIMKRIFLEKKPAAVKVNESVAKSTFEEVPSPPISKPIQTTRKSPKVETFTEKKRSSKTKRPVSSGSLNIAELVQNKKPFENTDLYP